MDAEGLKEAAEVVPDRLGAHVELGGDLLRRAALLEKTQHLDLTWGEKRLRYDATACGLLAAPVVAWAVGGPDRVCAFSRSRPP